MKVEPAKKFGRLRKMTMTEPTMPVENDCEDQGFTRIEDGCYNWRCRTFVNGKVVRPELKVVAFHDVAFWCCPRCGGTYGPVE